MAATKVRSGKASDIDQLEQRYGIELPYQIELRLRGVSPFLFNRMDIDAYDRETGPGKKKKPRSRPEYETMIWRDEDGELALPTANVIASIANVGKFFYGPTGGKSTMKAPVQEGVVAAEELAHFGVKTWDSIDFRHAKHGNQAGTPKPTYRPRLEIGWLLVAQMTVTLPEILGPAKLLELVSKAGGAMGVGDGRKIGFGRYVLDGHEVGEGLPW